MALKVKQFSKTLVVSSDDQRLPQDLVFKILLRLPVKSLWRFKSVSKNWNSLIKNPDFITNHYHHPNNHSTVIVRRFYDEFCSWGFQFCHDITFCRDKTPRVSSLDPYMLHGSHLDGFVGPVNGIFLLFKIPDPPSLWNPATREFKLLPSLPESIYVDSNIGSHAFGFGMDPLTNLMKVIWIIWKECPGDVFVNAFVYTLGNGSWRKLHLVGDWLYRHMYWVCPYLSNTYLDGVYYWVAETDEPGILHRNIISFNMEHDVFRKINVPDHIITKSYSQMIGLYRDHLAMFVYPPERETLIEIWVMEGYWTKQLTLGPFLYVMRALGFSENGLVFLAVGNIELMYGQDVPMVLGELVLYDPIRNQELTKIGPGLVGDHPSVVNYKESLVSLLG